METTALILIIITVILVLLLILSSYTMYKHGVKTGRQSSALQASEENLGASLQLQNIPDIKGGGEIEKIKTLAGPAVEKGIRADGIYDMTSVGVPREAPKNWNTYVTLHKERERGSTTTESNGSTTWADSRHEMSIPGFLEVSVEYFRIIQKLSAGGTSGVFLAEVTNDELYQRCKSALVVVKYLDPPTDPGIRSAQPKGDNAEITPFLQEVAMMSFFRNSPYFASIVGYTRDPTLILQKYYRYGTLFDYLHRPHRFPVDNINVVIRPTVTKSLIFRFAHDVSKALLTMHNAGFVHHDMKTPNLLLDYNSNMKEWRIVLTDFGVAKVADPQSLLVKAFRPIKPIGTTIVYSAPELIQCMHEKRNFDGDPQELRAVDIYAVGIVFYELVNRKIPWRKINS